MFNSRCCLRHCRCRWFTHIVLLPTRMLKTTTPILIPTLRRPLFAVRAEATKFASTETPLSPFRLSNRLFFVGLILLLHQIHLSSPPLFPHQEKTLSRRFLFLSPFLSSGRIISSPSQNGASNIPRLSPSPPSYPYNWREVREIRQSSLGLVQCGNPVSAPLGGGLSELLLLPCISTIRGPPPPLRNYSRLLLLRSVHFRLRLLNCLLLYHHRYSRTLPCRRRLHRFHCCIISLPFSYLISW